MGLIPDNLIKQIEDTNKDFKKMEATLTRIEKLLAAILDRLEKVE